MKTIRIRIDKDPGCGAGAKISGDVHIVSDDLESMDPEEAYGLGHEAGKEPGSSHKDHKCGPCGDMDAHEDEMLEEVAAVILEDLPEDCTNLRRQDLNKVKALISTVLEKIDALSREMPVPRMKTKKTEVGSDRDNEASSRGAAGDGAPQVPETFAQAFRKSRNAGEKFFSYNRGRGRKRYHTRLKGETEGKWAQALQRAPG